LKGRGGEVCSSIVGKKTEGLEQGEDIAEWDGEGISGHGGMPPPVGGERKKKKISALFEESPIPDPRENGGGFLFSGSEGEGEKKKTSPPELVKGLWGSCS